MKTPIRTAIEQIENAKSPLETEQAKGYNIGLEIALTFIRAQLSAEREAIEGAVLYALDEIADFGHMGIETAKDYFDQKYSP
jgi:hypothetical protein